MGLLADMRIAVLARRFMNAPPSDRTASFEAVRDAIVKERDKAEQRKNREGYCRYSIMLGRLLCETADRSDALRPLACAYVTACISGDDLRDKRIEAAEGLVAVYEAVGQYAMAAECAYEVLTTAERETELITVAGLVLFLSLVEPDTYNPAVIEHIYDDLREVMLDQGGVLAAMTKAVDVRLGRSRPDYAALRTSLQACLEAGDLLSASAHRALADAALRGDQPHPARQHIESAIALLPDDGPWLNAPYLGLAARIQRALGQSDEALALAVRGWAGVLPVSLWCKDDFARQFVQRLSGECIDVAIEAAYERRDWSLLTGLIENSRVQAAPAATVGGAGGENAVPEWISADYLQALTKAAPAGVQALFAGDWKSSLVQQVVLTHGGSRVLADAVDDFYGGRQPQRLTVRDALDDLRDRLAAGAVAWSAAVRAGTLYWTLSDADGSFDGGALDLRASGIEPYLAELRWLIASRDGDDPPQAGAPVDVLYGLARAGTYEERETTSTLARLVPGYIREVALTREPAEPLQVLFSLPPELSVVPWAVLPLNTGSDRPVRLVERVELTFPAPTAVRLLAGPGQAPTGPRSVTVSVANPDGELRVAAPVPAAVILDGNQPHPPVTLPAFTTALRTGPPADGAVLFVRSHLGKASDVRFVAEQGIKLGDGVLSARSLAMRERDGRPVLALPRRVVLALCSGAGTGDASGLTLGLAAACRLSGAQEVLTSHFNIIDSEWSCTFDHRLAAAATAPVPLPSALRALQIASLHEWQSLDSARYPDLDEGPIPLVWASYGVVI